MPEGSMEHANGGRYLERPAPSGLADLVELLLDRGLVIDAHVRVSLVGIELLTVDARVVVSSVDTFLRFAEATNRLDLAQAGGLDPIGTVVGGAAEVVEEVAAEVVDRKVTSAVETVSDKVDSAAAAAEEKVDSAVGKVTALVDSERGGEPTR
jgi:hypothetical protein